MDESEDQLQEVKGFLLTIISKNKLARRTRLDTRRMTTQHMATNPHQNCKHKEIIKGANEEGNEGEQLG